jgi:hypothetical protein
LTIEINIDGQLRVAAKQIPSMSVQLDALQRCLLR